MGIMWLQDFASAKILICFSSECHCWWNDRCWGLFLFLTGTTQRCWVGSKSTARIHKWLFCLGGNIDFKILSKWCVSLLKQELKTMSSGNLQGFFLFQGRQLDSQAGEICAPSQLKKVEWCMYWYNSCLRIHVCVHIWITQVHGDGKQWT